MHICVSPNSEDSSESSSPHFQQEETAQQLQQQQTLSVCENDDQLRVYLVPFRWWKDAQESVSSADPKKGILYTASASSSYGGAMKLINNFFSLDISFNLKKEYESVSENHGNGEVGVSGREYALVSGDMWLQAFKWHSDSKIALRNGGKLTVAEEDTSDVFPLQLRLSVVRDSNHFGVKISKKENSVECYKRACKIFSVETDMLRIWDLSGQTTRWCLNDTSKTIKYSQQLPEQDALLELQVYGLADHIGNKATQISNGTSPALNGCGNIAANFPKSNSNAFVGGSCEAGTLGLTGLQNLGNTCFMNSALQCLAHTPRIVDYFLGDYKREINHDNPLGMNGEIASTFGDLLKKLWAPGATLVTPRAFKSKLAHFAPQFGGYNQHDSQELLAFLLDGLHEDLNRVKCKPYVEVKDSAGRADEEVADEYWSNHLARNDSIIVDVCQGQYRSTLVCPLCSKVSITFDPFMYLSLPLPSTSTRTMTLTVVNTHRSIQAQPSPYTIHVPKNGNLDDLIQCLSTACSLRIDETLLIAEVFNCRIIRFLEDSANSLSLIRDEDRLIAYRVPKDKSDGALVVFMHKHMEEHNGRPNTDWKSFGIPLIACSKVIKGSDIRSLYLKLLSSFSASEEDSVGNSSCLVGNISVRETDDSTRSASRSNSCSEVGEDVISCVGFKFFLIHDHGNSEGTEIDMDEPVSSIVTPGKLNVLVHWPDDAAEVLKAPLLCSVPEVFKLQYSSRRPQETVSLYKCLEAFLKEEPLGPEDMWYCPSCKKHCQASKKLDLWRLPEVLVIHLKRFSYSRFLKNKLETYVDFPIHDLELSAHIAYKNGQSSHRYVLYAISNHYGNMRGGHYTAFVHHGGDQWYDFDDSHVSTIKEEKIKSSAAYVLFYRRVQDPEQ